MSTKEYGCFFCDGKSAEPDVMCPKCGLPIDVGKELLGCALEEYRPVSILGRGFYGWTIKAEDTYQPFAVKVLPMHRLANDPLPDREARSLAACSQPPHRNIVRFWRAMKSQVHICGKEVNVFCLVFDFVDNAMPFSKLLRDRNIALDRGDVVSILAGVSSGLDVLHTKGLWHNDLHDDNVLVRLVQENENLQDQIESKLIDFGSVRPHSPSEPESATRSDYFKMAKHILLLVDRFEVGKEGLLTRADRSFAKRLRVLAQRLSDPDVSRRNMKPRDVTEGIHGALRDCAIGHDFPSFEDMKRESQISFTEPLANTNALNLAPQDIALLFRDSLRWEGRMEKSEPVFVVGPRGCGKTMLLRFFAMTSQARPLMHEKTPGDVAARLAKSSRIGFLVSVGQLRTAFIRSAYTKLVASDKALAEDFCREYFNAQFAYEVVRTTVWLHSEKLMQIASDDLKLLAAGVRDLLASVYVGGPGSSDLDSLAEVLDKRIRALSSLESPESYRPSDLCRDDALLTIAKALKASSWTSGKDVCFLLDDYSVTVVPQLAQRAYNPVLFRLSNEIRLRVSSEGDGPSFDDSLGRRYKEGREFTKVNLGKVYFEADEPQCRGFFEQILEARFKETGKGSLEELKELLGEHKHEQGFGEYVCSCARPGNARFYGFGLICRLCSGDVSFIIELLHQLVQGRWGTERARLKEKKQDEIIKHFAHSQLTDLRSTADFGPKLHDFAERLGNLMKQYLLQSKGKENADERLRIEIEGSGELSQEAQDMHNALLRHSVLIPGGTGKSRAGLPTRKLYFRRLFAPCFPFSPSRKSCIPLDVKVYENWLREPRTIWVNPQDDDPDQPSQQEFS